jgi:hypothetical protein
MSFISAMAVPDGIIMMADMQVTLGAFKDDAPGVSTKYAKKLFTMGDNIAVSHASRTTGRLGKYGQDSGGLINEFCRANTFRDPQKATYALYDYIKKGGSNAHHAENLRKDYELNGEDEYVIFVAGYVRHEGKGLICPSVYRISTLEEDEVKIAYKGCEGFMQCGNMTHVWQYVEKINADKDFLHNCTLQDAVDASKIIFDMARGLERLIDHIDTISENFEMLALTPDGVRWLRKHELEIKQEPEVTL